MHKFLIIIGLSVLLYKASVVTEFQTSGTGGINEKELIEKYVPDKVNTFFIKYGTLLSVPSFTEFDDSKSNLTYKDKEAYKGTILMIEGMIYYSVILFFIYACFKFILFIFIVLKKIFIFEKRKEELV